ncbi:MAG: hypothetical protein RML37_01890, partial [Chitinophagales bacterium]|nr:hypothetical protein [Chitinophagales bacterium]
ITSPKQPFDKKSHCAKNLRYSRNIWLLIPLTFVQARPHLFSNTLQTITRTEDTCITYVNETQTLAFAAKKRLYEYTIHYNMQLLYRCIFKIINLYPCSYTY